MRTTTLAAVLSLLLFLWTPADAKPRTGSAGKPSRPRTTTTYRAKAPRISKPRAPKPPRATKLRSHRAPAVVRPRDPRGRIERSGSAKRDFMRASGYPKGRPGYVVDHIRPLACGGADAPSNMQWQTVAEAKAKDGWERRGCQ